MAKKINGAKFRSLLRTAISVIFISGLILSAGAPFASADLLTDQAGFSEIGSKAYNTTDAPKDIRIIVAQIIRIFLGFLGVIFVFLLILAGYKWMTAGGDEGKITEARQQITAALIGLLIVLSAYSITVFVTECALKASVGQGTVWYCPSLSS